MNDGKINEYLPDLPGLECVRSGELLPSLVIILFGIYAILFIAISAWAYVQYWHYLDIIGKVSSIVSMALVIYIFSRASTINFALQTDTDGLHISGIRKKILFWNDIESASYRKTHYSSFLVFKVNGKAIKVHPTGLASSSISGDLIIASVWQHLRRYDKEDNLELPASISSLWESVPDDIPLEIEWGDSPSLGKKVGAVIAIATFPIIAIAFWFANEPDPGWIMLWIFVASLYVTLTFLVMIPDRVNRAYKVGVKSVGLEVELVFKKLQIPWSKIISSSWNFNNQINKLNIKSESPKAEVDICYSPTDKESEKLVLAIIRQIRASNPAIAIPLPKRS